MRNVIEWIVDNKLPIVIIVMGTIAVMGIGTLLATL